MGLGATELIVILVIILLLFGGKKLPELSKSLANSVKELRKGFNESTESESGKSDSA